jgi:hypothetical protein
MVCEKYVPPHPILETAALLFAAAGLASGLWVIWSFGLALDGELPWIVVPIMVAVWAICCVGFLVCLYFSVERTQ